MVCRVQPGTRQREAPSWQAAEAKVTLVCCVCPKTHGRHSVVSGSLGHMADILCLRYHCRVRLDTRQRVCRGQKQLCRVNDIHDRLLDSGSAIGNMQYADGKMLCRRPTCRLETPLMKLHKLATYIPVQLIKRRQTIVICMIFLKHPKDLPFY
jgi:hypothetical protein